MAYPMKTRLPLLLFTAVLLLASCGSDSPSEALAPSGSRGTSDGQPIPVTSMTVETSMGTETRTFPGQVEGDRRVVVSTMLMARIDKIAAQEGDRVTKGDVLIELDASALNAEKARAEAMRSQAQTALTGASNQLSRFRALRERGSATDRELEEVETMHEQAEAALAAAESAVAAVSQQLTHAMITSPVTGHVVARFADPGAMAQPGQPIMEVETTSELRVVASVPEHQINALAEGQAVFVDVDAIQGRFQGRLRAINASSDAPARQYRVEVDRLEATSGDDPSAAPHDPSGGGMARLRPGMYARVHAETALATRGARIHIPEDALVTRGQLTGVWVITENNRALLRWIRPGAHQASTSTVEVLSGLSAGEKIILSARGRVTGGSRVDEQ